MPRRFFTICSLVVLTAAAGAQAQPDRYQMTTSVAPGQRAALTIGGVPRGQFAIAVRASSDGAKDFTLTQQRTGGRRFVVFGPATRRGTCGGAAGTIVCSGVTTPATPAGHRWTFRFTNASSRPMAIVLTVRWRKIASAG